MKDQFVTYEIAKHLKELGFNEPCFAGYCLDKTFAEPDNELNCFRNRNRSGEEISAPLWQQVIDWLREKHGYLIYVRPTKNPKGFNGIVDNPNTYESENCIEFTWETARESAITKALELI